MKSINEPTEATREVPVKVLPACRCGKSQSGNWTGGPAQQWLLLKPAEAKESESKDSKPGEPGLIEYECLSCHRRYRLRGTKFYEVTSDGAERAYMRQGQYGRWLSCR